MHADLAHGRGGGFLCGHVLVCRRQNEDLSARDPRAVGGGVQLAALHVDEVLPVAGWARVLDARPEDRFFSTFEASRVIGVFLDEDARVLVRYLAERSWFASCGVLVEARLDRIGMGGIRLTHGPALRPVCVAVASPENTNAAQDMRGV